MSEHREEFESSSLALGLEASLDSYAIVRALRNASGGIEDFSHVEVNERSCTYLGQSRGDLLARTMRDVLPAQSATPLVTWLASVVETGVPAERVDMPFFDEATGKMGRMDIRAVSDGDLVGYTFRDFGELRRAMVRYEWLLEKSSDVVVQLKGDGKIEWILDAVFPVLGYQPSELVGTNIEKLLIPGSALARLQYGEHGASAIPERFRVQLRDHDGCYHYFSAVCHQLLDGQGALEGAVVGLHLIDDQVAQEEEARHVEERYRLMVAYGTDVVSLERHGVVEWVSPYVEQLLDIKCDDLVGRSIGELVHPDDRTSLQTFYRAIEGAQPLTLTLRMRRADGSYRWVAMRSRDVVDNASGEKVRVASWRDAQDDVAARQALVSSERRFRLLAENSTDVVFECDEEGMVHWVSPSLQMSLGWRSENIVGTRLMDRVVDSDRSRASDQRREVGSAQPSGPVEVRYLTATGNVKWMSQRMRRIRGHDGEETVIIVTLHDVDDEVGLRLAVAEADARFRLLAENASEVVYTVNLEGELTWVSPSVVGELGWQVGDMVGHGVLDLIFEEDRPRLIAWRQLLHFGELFDDLIIRVRHGSGHFVWMKAHAQSTRGDDGRITGIVAVLRNCDDEVVSARALRTMSAGSRVLIREKDPLEMLRQMCQVAVDEGGYALAWYGRKIYDVGKSVEVVASSAGHESYLENLEISWSTEDRGQGPTGRAIRLGQASTIVDTDVERSFKPWRERAMAHEIRSVVAIPVVVNGEIDGAWQVYAHEQGAFAPEVLTALEDLALEMGYGLSRLDSTSN